ncbi:Putative peptidoglycan binding domain protein [Roseovarius sp. THAF9]|uniref:peptidoglycan-binding domain-containing protein n=1 Tax=Roseovarius sp. THAF9 TaxID=2587847 RepID=UPI0012689104|nr:peptidoglycan-binding domain-containing protein [Roseovarius sp. THAF9]QFT92361.1 Putative peptidoglycan binding domain protein [Roseovarius sp. THAF9]
MGQTQGAEPLPEPLPEPPVTATPLEDSAPAQGGAGIDVTGADADRADPAANGAADDEDRATTAQVPEADVLPEPATTRNDPLPLDQPGTARPLRDQIAACYNGATGSDGDDAVTISFVLDSAGLLRGIPRHVGDEAQSAIHRRLFLDAVVALEDCAPYTVSGTETTYEATFTPETVGTVNIVESAPLVTEPEVLGTARVDPTALATEEIEAALDLSRSERREIQNRLRLVEHDPGGADGVFGPNTRTAITSWQAEQGFPVSGYLDDFQLTALREQSETEYQAFLQTQPKPKPKRKAKRVRVCKRGVFGVLYDCRFVWR